MKDLNYTIIPYKNKLIELSNLESGKIIYKDYYFDLKTNQKVYKSYTHWLVTLEDKINTFYISTRVIHLYYELGHLFEKSNIEIPTNVILAIDLNYKNFSDFKIQNPREVNLIETYQPDFSEYKKKFENGYQELLAGNCYQFNLTDKFVFRFSSNLRAKDFIAKLWSKRSQRGAFGSATYIASLNKLLLSNSPECLFQLQEDELFTMPIKGTKKINNDQDLDEIKLKWEELINDKKCESELFMIADLMRNDLSRIDLPRSLVVSKKELLKVPQLIHQYSKIKVKLRSQVTIRQIIEKIFPGGSITGAPKKRVMEILSNLENRHREFYCGSTLIFHQEMKAASINIRSADIDFNQQQLTYQSGGGITLKSNVHDEYQEMSYKVKSFIDLLTP